MIDTGEQDVVFLHVVVDLHLEVTCDGVVEEERLLDAREVTTELNRAFVVGRDVGHTHQFAIAALHSCLQILL